jgi:hypothetical protein
MSEKLRELELQRVELFKELAQTGDLRRGSIAENYRCCGKSNCVCAQKEHPGHGPQYLLMTKVDGKSRSRNLKAGTEVDMVKEQVTNHLRFRDLVSRIVEINEQICDIRLVQATSDEEAVTGPKKNSRRFSKKRFKKK